MRALTAVALCLLLMAPTHAQTANPSGEAPPVADLPRYKSGDAWEFRYVQKSGKSGVWARTIDEVLPNDRVKVRREDDNFEYGDYSLNYVGQTPTGQPRVLVRYPLRVGDEWSFGRKFENPGAEQTGTVRVAAYEEITVPAGTFQCFRIEADTTGVGYPTTTHTTRIRWYCPQIRWIAKEIRRDVVSTKLGLGSTLDQVSELVRFQAGP